MAIRATAAGVSALLPYYNSIEGIRRSGGTRAEAWAEIQGIEGEGGPTLEGATIFDMNEVWQRAGAVLAAESYYARDLAAGALTGDAVAWAPWASQTSASFLQNNLQIRYSYEVVSPGGQIDTFWGQTDYQSSLNQTPSLDDITTRVNTSMELAFSNQSFRMTGGANLPTDVSPGSVVAVQLLRV